MDHGFAVTFTAAVFRRHAYQCVGTFYTPSDYQLLWCIRIFPDVQQFDFDGMHGCNDRCCRKYTPSGACRSLWDSRGCGCISQCPLKYHIHFRIGLPAGLLASFIKQNHGYPRISLTVPSIVIMVPGLYLYRAIYNFGIMSLTEAVSWFTSAIMIIIALPLGLIFARILTDRTFRYCT